MSAGYVEVGGGGVDSDDGAVTEPGTDVEGELAQPADNAVIITKDRTSWIAVIRLIRISHFLLVEF